MPLTLLHCRRFLIAAVAALVISLVLWWGVWSIAASQYRIFINQWIEAHRPEGYQVTYDSQDLQGFPRAISLHFSNFVLQNPDGVKIHANDVSLSTYPWRWHRFTAKLKRGFELAIPFTGEKTLFITTAATVHNHTELAETGDWKYINLEMTDAKAVWGTEPFFSAGMFKFAIKRPAIPPIDRTLAGFTFEGEANDLTLPPGLDSPFGAKVTNIAANFRVMGPVPDPRIKESVAAWNGANGTVEFDKFFLNWGPLILSTRGTLGLDDDLQPEGAFSGQIGNHQEVLKTLMAHDYIPKREAGMLDSALNLFAKKLTVGGKSGIEVPITVQLGGMFLGPVHVFEFPEIEWEPAPPEPAVIAPTATEPTPVMANPSAPQPQPDTPSSSPAIPAPASAPAPVVAPAPAAPVPSPAP
jgi:hypothetical protein